MKQMKQMLLVLLLVLLFVSQAHAYNEDAVVDNANLLSAQQEVLLEQQLAQIYQEYDFQILFLLEEDMGRTPIHMYAADYYDGYHYGYGSQGDGLVFALNMDTREYVTVTTGSGISLFSDWDISRIENAIVSDLSQGDYYNALTDYAAYSVQMLEDALAYGESGGYDYYGYQDDGYYDYDEFMYPDHTEYIRTSFSSPFEFANSVLPVVLVIAAVITLIVMLVMVNGMKTARKKQQAVDYMNHVNLTRVQDVYLYTTERRRKIQTQQSSGHGGGHSTFRGSSGRSHGGGRAGKF